MILRAANECNVNPALSWMVGDRLTDITAGRRAGCRTALLGDSEAALISPTVHARGWSDLLLSIFERETAEIEACS